MPRRNGIMWPWNPYQVFLWICLVVQQIFNHLAIIPLIPLELNVIYMQIFYSIFYNSSFVCILLFGALTTFINPTDTLSTLGIVVQNKGKSAYCTLCKSTVNLYSKHCGKCNRCVVNFDHHCKWVNNCIGQKNYRVFIITIFSFFVNSLVVLCFSIVIVVDFSLEKSFFISKNGKSLDGKQPRGAWIAEVSILIAYSAITSFFLCNLLIFHIYIKYKNITTFEYIKNRRARNPKVNNTNETIIKEGEVSVKPEVPV